MKTVLITGVSGGIGLALARKFLTEGFEVIGTIRHGLPPEKNEHLLLLDLDLLSLESIRVCAEKIHSLGKKIDILINNAGVLLDEDETKVKNDLLRKTLEVNLIGTIDFTERIIPIINSGGQIVNISSTAGSLELTDDPVSHYPGHYPAYKISKAALNMYTRTLAGQLEKENISVLSVHPGWVRTDMGGEEADMSPEEAADGIYQSVSFRPKTGQFLFKGESLPW